MAESLYSSIEKELLAITQGVTHLIANLANVSALLWERVPDINWVGFYLLEEDMLVLGPFQGKVACTYIPLGKGVCGKAALLGKVQRVDDVHSFPGHITCDSASNSEIVLPIVVGGRVFGVLDIDSPLYSRFKEHDEKGLKRLVRVLEKVLE